MDLLRQRVALSFTLLAFAPTCDRAGRPPPFRPPDGGPGETGPGFLSERQAPFVPPPPIFVDVTDDSGVDLYVQSGRGIAGGAALFDADGDGALDLFVANEQAPSRFYRGGGDTSFEDATEAAGLGAVPAALSAAVGDYDADGDADLYVGSLREDALYRNDGGVFTDVTEASGISGRLITAHASFGDLDGDGWLDIATAEYEEDEGARNRLYLGSPDGVFTSASALLEPGGVTLVAAFSDADGDGDADLLEANDFGMHVEPNRLYRNDSVPGEARLAEVGAEVGFDAAIYAMGIAPIDFDVDGDLDYYVTNVFYNLLLRNDGGVFTDVAREVGAGCYGWDDPSQLFYPIPDREECARVEDPEYCNREMDYIDAYAERDSFLLAYTSFAPLAADFDQDGWQDLFVVNGFVGLAPALPEGLRQPDVLLLGRADGTFEEQPRSFGADDTGDGRGAATGDLDGDGDLDLVIVNNAFAFPAQGKVRVYENVGAAPGAFLRVGVVGVTSNRDGIGAWVTAEAGGIRQLREVDGCAGFASCSDRTVHFGLGGAAAVERLEVRWPSGTVDVLLDVPAGTTVEVLEGSAPEAG